MNISTIPSIDRYCNNDALGIIFQYVGGFNLLTTIPFVCKRWRKVAKKTPLKFTKLKGWAFSLPDPLLAKGEINVSILASTKNKEFIPYRDLHQNHYGFHIYMKSIYWNSSENDCHYILGTFKFSDDVPIFYFALEQPSGESRSIVLHSDLFELLSYGTSLEMKQRMKLTYFDKLQTTNVKRKFKPYRTNKRLFARK